MRDVNKFITDFLDQGIGVKDDVKRLLVLIDKEKKKGVQFNVEVLNKVEKLSKARNTAKSDEKKSEVVSKINVETSVKETKGSSPEINNLPKYISPKNIAQFLTELNKNNILKTTTHSIDEDMLRDLLEDMGIDKYDYATHMRFIEEEFKKLLIGYNIPLAIYAKLNQFYFFKEKKGWSEAKVKVSWSSPEIVEWCKRNESKVPNPGSDLEYASPFLNKVENVNGMVLTTFQDGINLLKTQIECRDESYLENILIKVNQDKFPALNINIDNVSKNVRFYTDVEKVMQAYIRIINLCKEVRNKPNTSKKKMEIEVKLRTGRTENDDSVVVLSILDKGGVYDRDIDINTFRYGASYTQLIKYLNGLCHIHLKADLPNKSSVYYSLWPQGTSVNPLNEPVNGVQYDLIFYVN